MRVLVTRPEPDASRTARRVADLGFEPILLPLFECLLEERLAERIARPHAAIIFTSVNGVRAYAASGEKPDNGLPAYAVGERTAGAAREAGFEIVRIGDSTETGTGLARAILRDAADGVAGACPDLPLLYLAGEPRRPDLERILAEHSVPLWVETAYRMKEISYSTDFIRQAKLSPSPDAILLFSANAAKRLGELAGDKYVAKAFEGAVAVCLSEAVADALGEGLKVRARVAAAPSETAILETLATLR